MRDEETLYARFLSDELSAEEEKALRERGDLQKLETIKEMSGRFRMPPINKAEGFAKLKANKIAKSNKRVRSLNTLRWVSGIAASLLVAIGMYYFAKPQMKELYTYNAQTLEHDFGDDSKMILNAGSMLTYYPEKWSDERTVNLNGEAFFDVSPGAPFEVVTSFGKIQVLGTEFNVRAHDDHLSVDCFEGKVKVLAKNVNQELTAQQGLVIRQAFTSELYNLAGDGPDWRDGRSSFRNSPLEEVLNELQRQYDIEVISSLSGLNFQGSFDNNNLETAVNEIARPLGLNVQISSDRKQVTFSR